MTSNCSNNKVKSMKEMPQISISNLDFYNIICMMESREILSWELEWVASSQLDSN